MSNAPNSRRRILVAGTTLLAASAFAPQIFAQASYPARPIRFLVGFAAGGSADVLARILATDLQKTLGQPVVVENKTGASANIAAQALVSAPADGYSLLLVGFSHLTNPAMMQSVGFDPLKDMAMVSQVSSLPVVALARADSPLKNLQDVVAAGKAKNGDLKIGSGGVGTSSHFAAELLTRAAGFKYTHVPYRGGALAFQALLSGDIDLTFDFMTPSLKSTAEAGKIKFLGAMQREPLAMLPSIVPAAAQGLPESAYIRPWQAVAVRAGTPADIVARLHSAITGALKQKEIVEKLEGIGSEVHASASPQEIQAMYEGELKRWTGIVKAAGIKAE